MLFVTATTLTAGKIMLGQFLEMMDRPGQKWTGVLNFALTLFVVASVGTLLLMAVSRWAGVWMGVIPVRAEEKEPPLAA